MDGRGTDRIGCSAIRPTARGPPRLPAAAWHRRDDPRSPPHSPSGCDYRPAFETGSIVVRHGRVGRRDRLSGRGSWPPSPSGSTDACPWQARATGFASGAPVLLTGAAAGLARQIDRVVVGVLERRAPVEVLDQIREPHDRTGITLPPIGVRRMSAPTMPVRCMPLPKTIEHVGPMPTGCQLRHERPEYLSRTAAGGVR